MKLNKLKQLDYRYYLGIFVLGIVLVVSVVFILRAPQSAEAEWFNDGWYYRQSTAITNSGSAITNQYVKITLDTATLISASKMQSDCDDLRVTDNNGNLLTYFIDGDSEYDCNDSDTAIYTMPQSIPVDGVTLYLYYSNPSAENAEANLGSEATPALSCKSILEHGNSNGDANYYIIPSGNLADKIQVYCDMTTESGGWVKVYEGLCTSASSVSRTEGNIVEISNNIPFNNMRIAAKNWNLTDSKTTTETSFMNQTFSWYFEWLYDEPDTPDPDVKFHDVDGNQDVQFTVLGHTLRGYGNGWRQILNGEYYVSDSDSSMYLGGVPSSIHTDDWGYGDYNNYMNDTSPIESGLGLTPREFQEIYVWLREDNITLNIDQSAGSPSSEEKGPAPIAYWSFNEGYGTTAYDETSNNLDATLSSASRQHGISGWAFDGSDGANMTVSDNSKLDISDNITISFWYYPRSYHANYASHPISKWTGTADANFVFYEFGGENSGKYTWYANAGGSWKSVSDSWTVPELNRWYFITWTYNSSSGGCMYVDTVSTGCAGSGTLATNTANLNILSNGSLTKPSIDELKIYDYVRTEAQILTDYNAGLAGVSSNSGVSVSMGGESNKSLNDGLVGYWKMDEASWNGTAGEIIDASGNENHGVAVSGAVTTSTAKYAMAGEFDGADDYVNCGNDSSFNFDKELTISAWVNPSDDGWNHGRIAYKHVGFGFLKINSDGRIAYAFYYADDSSDPWTFGNTVIPKNLWTHIDISYKNGVVKIFLNGILDKTIEGEDKSLKAGTGNLQIGGQGSYFFDGSIDEVRIYNRALSSREIKQLYEYAPGPVGYWDFNEKEGTTAYDKSGNESNGTWNGSSDYWGNGKYGSAGNFNGTDNYVSLTNRPNGLDNFSLSMWFKIDGDGAGGYNSLIHYFNGNYNRIMIQNSSNQILFQFLNSTDYSTYVDYTFSQDQWYHLEMIKPPNGDYEFYVDGVLVDTKDSTNFASATSATWIGRGGTEHFNGKIDEVKVYNYARNQKQILEDMNGGRPAINSPIEYWKFDGDLYTNTNGTTATTFDSGSASYSSSGKYSSALDFTELATGDFTYVDANTLRDSSKSWTTNEWAGYQFIRTWSGSQYCPGTIDSNTATDIVFSSACDSFGGSLAYKIKKTLYVDAPMPNQPTDQISASLWFKSNGYQSARIARAENEALGLTITGTGVGGFAVSYLNQIEYTTSIHDNQWHYLAITWDGVTQKLYLDGELVNSGALSGTMSSSSKVLKLGTRNDGANEFFNGQIDEVKIWNYSLTEDEINLDYNQGKAMSLGSVSTESDGITASNSSDRSYCVPGDTATCNPPIAEWKFDEKTGTTAYDTSENSNNGTLTNMESTDWTRGKIGSALDFDGDDDQVILSASSDFDFELNDFSMGGWFWADDNNDDLWAGMIIGDTYINGQEITYNRFLTSNTNGDPVTMTYSPAPINESWNYIMIVHDVSSKNLTAYLNGNFAVSKIYTYDLVDTNNIVRIGGGSWSYKFTGKIDQVQIYDYARTPAQIAWDYNKGAPIAHWSFNEGEYSTIHDETENINHGTLNLGTGGNTVTSTVWQVNADCQKGECMDFDGTDDYVDLGNTVDYDNSEGSVSTWFNTSSGALQFFIGDRDASGPYFQTWIQSGIVQTRIFNGSASYNTDYSHGGFADGNWHHLVTTWGEGGLQIYVDGQFIGENLYTGAWVSDSNMRLGEVELYHETYNLDGKLDEVKIYNYALTSVQVQQDYNMGKAIYFK
jgi:concanavalin A-like lectin/glucanase superfamily protein/uncharacterized protein DUF2341